MKMKFGVIGLGTIAQKAYLPIYTTEFPQHEWFFSTRDKAVLEQVKERYGVPENQLFTDWKELAEKVDAVFIHTPTHTHGNLIRYFLTKGVAVFVDKPISDQLDETKELIALSKETGIQLTTGFNRRFAPMVQKMKEIEGINQLHLQKNQENRTDFSVRYRLYDMMIHPIDTALYLAGESLQVVHSKVVANKENFIQATVMLENANTQVFVSINNQSGARKETYELQSPEKTVVLDNLTDWAEFKGTDTLLRRAGDWDTTLEKRGFLPILQVFISSLEGNVDNPVSLESALASHEVCESIIQTYENQQTI